MDDNDIFSSSEPFDNDDEIAEENNSIDLNSFSSGAVDKERKKRTKKKRKKEKVIKYVLTVILIGIITFSMVVGTFLVYVFTMVDGTMEQDLNNLELNFTTTIFVKGDNEDWVEYQRLHGEYNRIWTAYNEEAAKAEDHSQYNGIPQQLVDAFVAVEDKRFYTHYGVDWKRTFGSLVNLFIPIYSSRQGGSTITQQLVKNLTNDRDEKASRKVREIMRARYLEDHYSKDTIIECYLNTIPMGHGLYGVEVAANYYFGKSVNELTLLECASLASITKAPLYYAPDDNAENNKSRRETVLALMLEEGYIKQDEYEAALKDELNVIASRDYLKESEVNNYFVDALIVQVTKDLSEKYGWDEVHAAENFYSGGYKIFATVDPEIQATIDKTFSNSEKYGIKAKDGAQLQGAITVMDYNGRVVGLAGGIGEKTVNLGMSGFNRATDAVRQPGSTMKPLAAYAPAIEKGIINYSSRVNDTARNYNGWTPNNWYNSYMGSVTAQYALERSINTIPVYLVDELTTEFSFDFVTKKLGISTLTSEDKNLSPLGMGGTNGGVTTIESAAAYAVFGNGGKYNEPTLYYAVYDQHYEVVLSNEELNPTVAVSSSTATVMNKMLQQVVYGANGTGKAARDYIPNMPIYAKTGTSNNSNDLWFVGGSPYYVASCWCGYDQQQAISDQGIARKMWGAVMSEIHKGLEPRSFVDSKYALQRYYCTETGLLATDACPTKALGWYTKSGMPKTCSSHNGKLLDAPTTETDSEDGENTQENNE